MTRGTLGMPWTLIYRPSPAVCENERCRAEYTRYSAIQKYCSWACKNRVAGRRHYRRHKGAAA